MTLQKLSMFLTIIHIWNLNKTDPLCVGNNSKCFGIKRTVSFARNLGLIFNQSFSFGQQLPKYIWKTYYTWPFLYALRSLIDQKVVMRKSRLITIFLWCTSLWTMGLWFIYKEYTMLACISLMLLEHMMYKKLSEIR